MENMNEAHVRQNLIDAGCDSATINDFFNIVGSDQFERRIMLLRKHRKKLLEGIHQWQYEIDCLDYLIIQMEKQCGKKGGNYAL